MVQSNGDSNDVARDIDKGIENFTKKKASMLKHPAVP